METVISTTTQNALEIAASMVKRQVGYFVNCKDKFVEAKQYIEMLNNARMRIQHQVNDAEMNAEEIEDDVRHWLKLIDEKIKIYECFIDDERHAKTTCSIGLILPNNLWLRYRLGRKATKMVEEIKIDGHFNKEYDKVSYRVDPSMDIAFSNNGYVSIGSRSETLEKIMKALEDSTVNMIGVYGVGGVGKTTLVKEVAKQAQMKLINTVVMANITRNPDIKKIQGQIAEMLGMKLEEESEIVRAARIRRRLKKEKESTLIILDDLWGGLDLNRVGIPCGDDDAGSQLDVKDISDFGYNKMEIEVHSADFNKMKKDKLSVDSNKIKKEKLSSDYRGCKILLTSRSKEVICYQMNVEERSTFSVGVVDEKEAEILLKKVAGIHVTNSVFDGKAIEIVQMCAGLPIALVSIGRALKNKSSVVWEDVCQKIRRQSFTEGHKSIEFSVKLSYDHLRNEQLKHIFLHCARMGSDALIMDLVKFCVGLGLLQGVHTIREARSRVNALIEELKESSLLLDSYSIDRFNMHDIVRDVALSISSKEKHVLFMKNDILDEWPHKDELGRYTAIFLHNCDINDGLPESIDCPRLEVLHIDSKDDTLKIPDDFFKDMIELRVLILSGVNLSSLPSSIKCLTKLRMLSLERCTLGNNLSIIGELNKLRILTLSASNIESLPLEFGQLDRLQLFDLSNCSKLRVIPSNVISRMNSLEEFYMRDDLILREVEEKNQSENAILSELRHLNKLSTLEIHIPSVVHFPQKLFFDKLDSYKIVIGDFNMLSMGEFKVPDKYEAVKFLALNLKDVINIHSEKWIKMLFKGVEYLLLGELKDVHDVFSELNVEGFLHLKHLFIVNNFDIQYIINSMGWFHPLLAFPKLESLCLNELESLEKICDNQLTETSFCRLKTIKIKTCGQLENIFSFYMLRCLTMLETIEVSDCDSLKEIVSIERESYTLADVQADKIEFPQLRNLTLQSLPAFSCLYTNNKMSSISQLEDQVPNKELEEITIVAGQDTIASLSIFNGKVSVPKLEWLELSSINITQIWSDQSLYCFQNLLTLNISDCCSLKYLLSVSMAGNLVNLQSLFISGCELMEDIFSADNAMLMHNIVIFPKLKKLVINNMEKLNTIWQPHIGVRSFHSLDSLIIRGCKKLVTIFPSSYVGQGFQSLQSLEITNCKSVETIFDFGNNPQMNGRKETNLCNVVLERLPKLVHVWKLDTDGVLRYNNLQSIVINDSDMLEYLFPLSVANGLQKLETLNVSDCRGMKEIVAWENGSNEQVVTFRFPQLITLSLQYLSELRSFYRGTHTLEMPLLKKLYISVCSKLEEATNSQVKPIFQAIEKVIHNLEYMSISLKETEWLRDCVVSVQRMHKLQSLVLSGLNNADILFWLLHRLPNLDSITLMNCLLEGVWAPRTLAEHEKIGVVVQLKELIFNNVWYLQNIGFEHDLLLQRAERLVISGCQKLKTSLPSSVSFSYLTYLEVTNCLGLRNLMSSSTAKTLVQLTTMKVSLCQRIVKIIAEEEEEQVIEFRQLKDIELVSLQSLTCFCSSDECYLKFPSLENLVVSDCPLMKTFSKVQSAPNLRKIHVAAGDKDKWYWEGDLNTTLQTISTDQVSFVQSKDLTLTRDSELEKIWYSKDSLPNNYFGNLKTMVVKDITKDVVIPSQILSCLKSLEELQVDTCGAVEVIFDIDDIAAKKGKRIVSRLKKLSLDGLPNLKRICNKKPLGLTSFSNLQEVSVTRCESLATLFPSSLARTLVKLETLEIHSCSKLEEIVGKEDEIMDLGTTKIFEFPRLSWLLLYKLPLLSCFYPGKHSLECPILKNLDVSFCPKLKQFSSEFQKEAVIGTPVSEPQQPLFSIIKVVPKLEGLTLNEENIMLLSDAHLPQDLLSKLNILDLSFEDDKKDTLPFDFLHNVSNLEHLRVYGYTGLKKIFPSQNPQVHEGILARLTKLSLIHLTELESVGLEHPWVKTCSQKLQSLILINCSRLENLVCSVVSFVNLKELFVKDCESMEYLLTSSTVKSLVQLVTLTIKNCESMKQIVTKEDENASHDIIFERLRVLELDTLPKLVRFYSGNATLLFQSLEEVTVAKCPNMKNFSKGVVNAPMSCGINSSTTEDSSNLTFHDDLNTTMESLFHHQDIFKYTKHMILVDYIEMTGVWHGKPAFSDNFFGSFKKLEFDGTTKRDIVIPSHVLPYLKSLEELNVHSCHAVQTIFDINDNETNVKGVFPLKKLTLKDLSNLKFVWNRNPQGIVSFPNLEQVNVVNCGSLLTLFPSSLARSLEKLQELGIQRCDKLVEIVGKEDSIELGTTEMFEFPSLWNLCLYKLPLLSCFYPGKYQLECPILGCLLVGCCSKLKLLTSEFHDTHQEAVIEGQVTAPISRLLQQPLFSIEKVVPELKALVVNEEIMMLLSNGHLPLDNLISLVLMFEDDHNEKDTFPFDFLHKVPNLIFLWVQGFFGLKEIFPCQKLQVHDGMLVGLNELALHKLKELESIGLEHPWVKPFSEKLKKLTIGKCSRLEKLVQSAVSFINLKELKVKKCEKMVYLFTSTTAKCLVQLKILTIKKCESIKEIVEKEDEDASEEIIFGQLAKLKLDNLPRLVRFYSGNATLHFSCLETMTVATCPNMRIFSEAVVNAPMFDAIQTSKADWDCHFYDDLNTTIKRLFQQRVEKSACDIEHLKFGDHPHLEEIWLGVVLFPTNSCFNNLKSLIVVECESLPTVIPSYLLRFLCNLKEIEVRNCQSVKAIFGVEGTGADIKLSSQISLPLKKMILDQLPNLEHIWNMNLDETLTLQDLQEVYISKCQSLKSLFPTSVANNLVMLDVRDCASLVKIFVEDEAALKGESEQFIFHCLTSLTLWKLQELEYFYNGKHSLEWPRLNHLDIYHCDKLKLFTSEDRCGEVVDIKDPLGISIDQRAIFSVEKVFPNLVQLSLKKEDTLAISQMQFQVMPSLDHQAITCKDNMTGKGQLGANVAHLLQNLKVLKLICYHDDDESNIFSSGLLEEIPSIENLEVVCSSFNEIFSSQRPITYCTKVLSKLKRLHLKSLQQLNSVGFEHSWVEPLLKTLLTLEVFSCSSLKILVPSTVSFSNLTSLNVGECHGLVYLFTSSTAKSLGQLKHMSVRDCQTIQEIVSKEEDHESNIDEEITFEQLSVLSLESLPNLVGIYSGTYELKFPSLDQVTLIECPQMKYSYVPDLQQFKSHEQI